MATANKDAPVVNEEVWCAWVERGRLREKETARKAKVIGGITLIALTLGGALYLLR